MTDKTNDENNFFDGLALRQPKQEINMVRFDDGTWNLSVNHYGVSDATMKKVSGAIPMIMEAAAQMAERLLKEDEQKPENN